MKKLQVLIFLQSVIIVVMLLGGCASSASPESFPRAAARTSFDVYYGEVVQLRVVEIEGDASRLGIFGGAMIGQAIGLGNTPWYRSSRRLEGAIGAVGGSIAGRALERKVRRQEALEVIVHLDHNETIAVVQSRDLLFSPGERVQVLMGRDGSARVQAL